MASFLTNLTTNRFAESTFKTKEEIKELNDDLDFYAKHFLVFPEEWLLKLKCIQAMGNACYFTTESIIHRALFDFYSQEFFDKLSRNSRQIYQIKAWPFDRCMNYRYFNQLQSLCLYSAGTMDLSPIFERELSFPHSKLESVYFLYLQVSISPPSKEIFQKVKNNRKLYKKLMDLKSDNKKWFEALKEIKDDRFIIQNVENQISKSPFDKELWKDYIGYLKSINQNEAAEEIYYRYLRLFLDDRSLEAEFPNFESKDQIFYKQQKGFLYQMKFRDRKTCCKKYQNLNQEQRRNFYFDDEHYSLLNNVKKEYCTKYYSPPSQSQNFKIRFTLLQYLIKNASLEVMTKLYKCCKYFFHRKNLSICYSLSLGGDHDEMEFKYLKNSLSLNESTIGSSMNKFTNLWIQQNLHIRGNSHPFLLTKIIPKLSSCSIRQLKIMSDQNISVSDYKFLTQSKRIQRFYWKHGSITNDDGSPIDLKDLLEPLPEATVIATRIKTKFNPDKIDITSIKKKPHLHQLRMLLPVNLVDINPKIVADILSTKLIHNSNTVFYFPTQFTDDFKKQFSADFISHCKNLKITFMDM